MDFGFTEEQLQIQAIARDFAQKRIAPVAADFDKSGEFPLENIKEMGQLGLMGIEVPAEYGGAGMDAISYVLAMIEIAQADCAHSTIMSVNNTLYCNGILKFGTEEQKQKYVKPIASGEAIGAFALTEPQSGSDATAMRCRAVKQADGSFIINGKKSWITSGPVAKYILLFAMSDPDKHARGVTAFMIDTDRAGFHRGKTEPKLGIRASATCEIEFTDYHAPAEDVIGEVGHGFKIAMGVLDAGRIGIASQAVGLSKRRLRRDARLRARPQGFRSVDRLVPDDPAKDRRHEMPAGGFTTAHAARRMGQAAGRTFLHRSGLAKLTASEAAMWITHQAVQIHGGMGYSKEMPLERYFRDAKITEIYEGTSEIQRLVIARNETGLR